MMSSKVSQTVFIRLAVLLLLLLFFTTSQPARADLGMTERGDGLIQEVTSQRIWQKKRSKKIRTPEAAQAYIAKLNQGEYHDWRLPTKQELYELFSIFDLKRNGNIRLRLEGKYWLSDPQGNISVGGWEIGDGCGPSRSYYPGTKGYVRAVRGSQLGY